MNNTYEIIDAHLHLPTKPDSLEEKRLALLAEMAKNGISKGVVISDSEIESCIGSLTECAELFADCHDIAVVGGISPYICYERQLELMDDLLSSGLLAGIKLFCGHEPIYLTGKSLEEVYTLAGKHRVPVLFHSGWDNACFTAPEIIRRAAEDHPEIDFVCCHCCYPRISDCFDSLADCCNVHFDLSSVAEGRIAEFLQIIEAAIHNSPDRFIFGSDFGSCNQAEHLAFFRQLEISESEQRMLFSENAKRMYRL